MRLMIVAAAACLALLAAQLWLIGRVELTFDEAYYTLWSRGLAWGYLDHPPVIAAWIRASMDLFGPSEFGVRALNTLIFAAQPALVGGIAWRLFASREVAALAALLWVSMPLVAAAPLATPDTFRPILQRIQRRDPLTLHPQGPQGRKGFRVLLGERQDRGADPTVQFALRARAGLGRDLLAPLEHHQGGDGPDAELLRDLRVLVDVELGDLHLALHLRRDFLQRGGDHPARTAPLGPEVYDHGLARTL